jgi:galactitol-specific phosphotransferase system IIB component
MVRAAIVGLGRWGRSLVASVQGKSSDIRFVVAHTRTPATAAALPITIVAGETAPEAVLATEKLVSNGLYVTLDHLGEDVTDLAAATAQMEGLKGKESSISSVLTQLEHEEAQARTERVEPIRKIVFACDAGMGSSAMGASVLRNKLKKAGFEDVSVVNVAIANLDDSYDLVVTHKDLTLRAMDRTPSAQHVSVDNFMNSPKYDEIVELVRSSNTEIGADAPAAVRAAAPASPVRQLVQLKGVATTSASPSSRPRRSSAPPRKAEWVT